MPLSAWKAWLLLGFIARLTVHLPAVNLAPDPGPWSEIANGSDQDQNLEVVSDSNPFDCVFIKPVTDPGPGTSRRSPIVLHKGTRYLVRLATPAQSLPTLLRIGTGEAAVAIRIQPDAGLELSRPPQANGMAVQVAQAGFRAFPAGPPFIVIGAPVQGPASAEQRRHSTIRNDSGQAQALSILDQAPPRGRILLREWPGDTKAVVLGAPGDSILLQRRTSYRITCIPAQGVFDLWLGVGRDPGQTRLHIQRGGRRDAVAVAPPEHPAESGLVLDLAGFHNALDGRVLAIEDLPGHPGAR